MNHPETQLTDASSEAFLIEASDPLSNQIVDNYSAPSEVAALLDAELVLEAETEMNKEKDTEDKENQLQAPSCQSFAEKPSNVPSEVSNSTKILF